MRRSTLLVLPTGTRRRGMHGWETRMRLKYYLDQGVSKSELSRRFGISRRTIHHSIATGQLDRDLAAGDARPAPRRPGRPRRSGRPPDPGQLWNSQDRQGEAVVAPPPAVPLPFHADLQFLAQFGRAFLRKSDGAPVATRQLSLSRSLCEGDPRVPENPQRAAEAVPVDKIRRRDDRISEQRT